MWRMTRCSMSTPRRGGVYWRRRSLNPSPSTSLLQTLPSPSFGCSSAPASDSSIFIFMDFSDENETGFFSMRRISRLITNTLRWSLFDLFLILLSLKKLFYFRSWSNCYLHLLAYYVKTGNDSIASLFLDLSPPTGGTLKINFYSENMNYLVFFRTFVWWLWFTGCVTATTVPWTSSRSSSRWVFRVLTTWMSVFLI